MKLFWKVVNVLSFLLLFLTLFIEAITVLKKINNGGFLGEHLSYDIGYILGYILMMIILLIPSILLIRYSKNKLKKINVDNQQ